VREQLSDEHLQLLASFSDSCATERGGTVIRLHHGDLPCELGRRIWPDSPGEAFDALSGRYPETVFLHGHTHIQFKVERRGRLFVNPGGVGQQRLGQPLACYAVLQDGELDLRAVPYDIEKTCRGMDCVPLEDKDFVESWKTCYRTGVLPSRYGIRSFTLLARMGYR
jgi:predicted phosphodiesterase